MTRSTHHKQTLPPHFAVLGGPHPQDGLGFRSDRIQILWNCSDEPWSDPGQHHHSDSDEVFVVLRGTIDLEVDEERVSVGAGEVCFFPAGVFHALVEVHTPIEALVIRAPAIADKIYGEVHGAAEDA